MATIYTRETGETAVNRALTNAELDNNFINLNADVATRILSSEKAAANGVASLDATGKIPSTQLPSYVDDVLEAANLAAFPATGETSKIYVALDTNKTYRWSGSTYVYITSGAVDSVAGKTGVVTLEKSDVGLANVENKSSQTIRSEITSSNVTTALGFTPYNAVNPNGYITSAGTATNVSGTVGIANGGTGGNTPTQARANLGLTIGANVQAYSGYLATIAGFTPTADNFIVGAGLTWQLKTPAQARSSLGGTTLGQNLFTVTNPSAVTFLRINADNTVSALSASDFRTAIGAGADGVTSFNTRTGAITLSSADVTTALGFTPYNATNPSGYITSSALSSYLPLTGGTLTGSLTGTAAIFSGQGRFGGWYTSGTGNAVEVGISGGAGYVIAYDRTASAYTTLNLQGGGMLLQLSGSTANVTGGALQQGGNQVLHAGNYNSYAPTLTGTGASGTWGISISGNAATATTATTASNVAASADQAIVNQNNGNASQWYGRILSKNSTNDRAAFLGTYSGIAGVFAHNNALSAWATLYVNTVDAGSWGGAVVLGRLQLDADGADTWYRAQSGNRHRFTTTGGADFIIGNSSGAATLNGNQLLTAGNYTSYSPSLTGSGASGSWNINAATVTTVTPGQLSPLVTYTTPTDASGYTWIRFEFANGDSFNSGQQQIEFYVTRAITDNGNNPYGGCTAKFTAQAREWHSGQEMMLVQYGEHGSGSSAGQGYYISHARIADFAGGGYWVYLRVRSGITYRFREALHGGAGCNFSSLQGTTDPGSGQAIFAGLNLISTGGDVNYYDNGSAVLHAGNYSSYALPLSGGTLTGAIRAPQITAGGSTNTDANLGVQGTTHLTGTIYYGGTVGSVNSWSSISTSSAGTHTFSGSRFVFDRYGYGSQALLDLQNGSITLSQPTTVSSVINATGPAIRQGSNLARPLATWASTGATGMAIFKLPGSSGNYGMVHMVFDIYEYNSNSVSTVIVGGHNWASSWYNTGANVIGQLAKQVRLGYKDGQYCVVFGDSGSYWEYGTIVLRKIHNADFYNNIMDLGAAVSVEFTATESFSSIGGDLRALRTPASFNAVGAITQNGNQVLHAGNYSSYALPISGGTMTGTITSRGIVGYGVGGDSGVGHDHYRFGYQESGPWSHPYPDLIIGYHTGMKLGAYFGYGGIRFYNDHPGSSSTEIFSVGNGDNNVRVANALLFTNTISLSSNSNILNVTHQNPGSAFIAINATNTGDAGFLAYPSDANRVGVFGTATDRDVHIRRGDKNHIILAVSGRIFTPSFTTATTPPTYEAFFVRAWVNFRGDGVVTMRSNGNVSSISDNGTGDYTVNFFTGMADADYAVVATGSNSTNAYNVIQVHGATTPTTSAVRIACVTQQSGVPTATDIVRIHVAIVR